MINKSRFILILLLSLSLLSYVNSQDKKVDSLQRLLFYTKGEARVKVLHALVLNLWFNYPDSAKVYAREAIKLSKELNDLRLQSISNRLLGGAFNYRSEFDSGKVYNEKALRLGIECKDSTLISMATNNLGLIFYQFGSYPEAFEYLQRSYAIKLKLKVEYGLGYTINNIGLVYMKVGDYESALSYFNEALLLNDKNSTLYSLNNIGTTYLLKENYAEAEKFHLEALHVASTINNRIWEAAALDGLGQAYNKLQLANKARDYFSKALQMRNQIHDKKGESETYYHLSKMFVTKNTDSAFLYLRKSQQLARNLNATDRLIDNYAHFKILFQLKNRLDSALYYQMKYDELKGKQFIENAKRSIEGINLKTQDEESHRQLILKSAQLAQKNYQITLYLYIGGMLLAIIAFVFWLYATQKKMGTRLTLTNQEINKQKDEIEIKTAALQKNLDELKRAQMQLVQSEKMASLGLLTAGIAHEINNPVNFISVGIEALNRKEGQLNNYLNQLLNHEHVAEESISSAQEKIIQLIDDIKIGTTRTGEIISSLRYFSRMNEAELKLADVHHGIESTLILLNSRLKDRIDVIKKLDTKLPKILCYPGELNQVFMNILTNAADAIKEKGSITITTSQVNNHIDINIKDSGCGIPMEIQEKIFEPFFTTKDVGAGTGLGLSISYGIIKKHKGTIAVSSEIGVGTELIIRLPLDVPDASQLPKESMN